MKQGFALIDLLVSIAISGIMSLAIFTMIFQVQKSQEVVIKVINTSMQAALINERMQKDLSGLFRPILISEKQDSKKTVSKDQEAEPKELEIIEPKIAKVLYLENTQFNELTVLKEATFITCNPLQIYNSNSPRAVRVIYKLEPDKQTPDSLVLYRQESINLDYNQVVSEVATQFILGQGLRLVNISYIDQDGVEQDFNESQNLPCFVKLNLSIWEDITYQNYQDYEFWYYLNTPSKKKEDKIEPQPQDYGEDEAK